MISFSPSMLAELFLPFFFNSIFQIELCRHEWMDLNCRSGVYADSCGISFRGENAKLGGVYLGYNVSFPLWLMLLKRNKGVR